MPSAWVAHVKKYYTDRRKKDKTYKYSSAMKDARALGRLEGLEGLEGRRREGTREAEAQAQGRQGTQPRRRPGDPAEPKPKSKPKKKPKRKRPGVPKDFTNLN